MGIRTQFIVTVLLFGAVLLGIAASVIATNYQVARISQQEKIADSIARGASELSYLASDYVIYRESQQFDRWQARYEYFSADVENLTVFTPQQQSLTSNIQDNTERMKEVFDSVVGAIDGLPPGQEDTLYLTMIQTSWSRMAVQSQALVTDASRLSGLLDAEESSLRQRNTVVLIILIALLGMYFLANYMVTQRRVLKGIVVLQDGTSAVGSGNLDFRIESGGNDEIAHLSQAFNRMIADLKSVTASKSDLEQEVARRVEVEEELRVINTDLQEHSTRLIREVEERKKAEQELEQQRQLLEEMVQDRTRQLARQIDMLGEAEQRIRSLSKRLIQVQERERREIGHALHDEVGGTITVLKLMLNQARSRHGETANPAIEEINRVVGELADQVRLITHSLRPGMLDDFGLIEALQWYCDRFRERTGMNISFTHAPLSSRLPTPVETTGYRIVQEALSNAARHSGAESVQITLDYEDETLTISISDDGRGIDPQKITSGMGLLGMQDLAELAGGSLTIDSSPGLGTLILCRLPLRDGELHKKNDVVQ